MGEIYFMLLVNAIMFGFYFYDQRREKAFTKHWETTIRE